MNSKYDGWVLEELISEEEIKNRLKEIGREITDAYKDKTPILIAVLNGSFIFVADLIRELDIECEIDFIKLSSYMNETKSSGTVRLVKDISANITDRDLIIIEDIVDSGLTVKFLKSRMEGSGPSSVAFVTLLHKAEISEIDFELDYVGFTIPNKFVVGYGLDLDQKYRKLPAIYAVKETVEKGSD
ncbi:MAG: hypoxanthine phosphoribosyltransferase [Candidatus Marinimicrobia bacterium]|nr:hypoxanthine phosphoribosyltransferase [Candidatus Neomarinimicrobiota bacterium]MCF7828983.1 hypoxanthine phosphoribosyltransferase [Candidatus Neomarinimicrobiota bacterium]MCF7879943.1 hypoxanthine phosphoribosyltransferase [Candidatus Neomarinimicrobiota bacterium]